MIKILVISIGNEILQGKTVNTNLAFIGNSLSEIGFELSEAQTIKDNSKTIKNSLADSYSKFDVIITTGGLGPTKDDMTKQCFSDFFQTPLEKNEKVWKRIKNFYKKNNGSVPEFSKSLATIPRGFNPIPNKVGTAPGLHKQKENKHFFALPGVPAEMKSMMENYVMPKLKKEFSSSEFFMKTIRTFGIRESILAEKLSVIENNLKTDIAFLPKKSMVDIRIYGYNKDDYEKALALVQNKIGKYIYGYDNDTLISVCHKKLMDSDKVLTVAESCTGGLIQNLFTNNPGSSQYFTGGLIAYSNEIKNEILQVKKSTLKKFGAVSRETVREMLNGVTNLFHADYGLAVSGIAGPTGGTKEKPIGLVYIGFKSPDETIVQKHNFSGSRLDIKEKTANHAIDLLHIHI